MIYEYGLYILWSILIALVALLFVCSYELVKQFYAEDTYQNYTLPNLDAYIGAAGLSVPFIKKSAILSNEFELMLSIIEGIELTNAEGNASDVHVRSRSESVRVSSFVFDSSAMTKLKSVPPVLPKLQSNNPFVFGSLAVA